MNNTETRIEALTAGIAQVLRAMPVGEGSKAVVAIMSWDGIDNEADWLNAAEARLAAVLEPGPAPFDPAKVGIHRKRTSVTQETVTITYQGRTFGPFHSDTRPQRHSTDDHEAFGWFSPGDAEWIETARDLIRNNR